MKEVNGVEHTCMKLLKNKCICLKKAEVTALIMTL